MDRTDREKKIARAQSGTVRASLLGLSDGLTTNVALILGVAASGVAPTIVRVAGIASLIAGASSMAVGEYISMRGQVELLSSVLDLEHEEFHAKPKQSEASISELLIRDGVSERTAKTAAAEIMQNQEMALHMYLRQRFGLNIDELGAAWGSAISSFFTFSIGALVPLLPWLFAGRPLAVYASLGLSILSALAVGGYLGYSTNGKVLRSALRQLVVLVLAAGVTYLIGSLFHTHLT